MSETITLTTYDDCLEAYRNKDLEQALYNEGEVIMDKVLVTLHGKEHRSRRRVENRLFRREIFLDYERDIFPPIIDETLKPHVAAGGVDLAKLGHQLLLNLSAPTAGLDRPLGTPEETADLYRFLMKFIEGATLAHSTRDKAEVRAEVEEAKAGFDEEFFGPSYERRAAMVEQWRSGDLDDEELCRDILTLLLVHDDLDLPREVILREVAFYMLAGAHTSATAFTRTLDSIFKWLETHPEDRQRIRTDRLFVQRMMHETVRLNPSSPIGMRTSHANFVLRSGIEVHEGDTVVFDLMSANRDEAVFGPTAGAFDPTRELPESVHPVGLSFGSGTHACIGAELAGGVLTEEDIAREDHLYGLVAEAVQAMIVRGAEPDPDNRPKMDTTTKRPYWSSYPIVFR